MTRLLFLALLLAVTVGGTAVAEKMDRIAAQSAAKVDGEAVVAWLDDRAEEIPWRRIKKAAKAIGKELTRLAD